MHQPVYFEIPSSDVKASAAFYAALFGWKTTPSSEGYIMFETPEGIPGGIEHADDPGAKGVRVYVHVEDIPATLRRAGDLGATVVKEKTAIGGEHGFWAAFRDPGGCASVMVWAKT